MIWTFLVGTMIAWGTTPGVDDLHLIPIERSIEATVYAYTSLPSLTDSSPFHTATGERVFDGVIANNCLKFGTKVFIDGKIFIVKDRMNSRYGCSHFDIWLPTYKEAKNWGKQRKVVYILEDNDLTLDGKILFANWG